MPVGLMDMVHFMEYYPREWEIMIKKDEMTVIGER